MGKAKKKRSGPSGPNIPDHQRHTVKLQIRTSPELAARAREVASAQQVTLGDVLEAGCVSLEALE